MTTANTTAPKPSRAPRSLTRSPLVLLMLMAVAMQLSHQVWHTLINNFSIEQASFTGREIGILQSVREIPGFMAFAVIYVLLIMREQSLALLALALLGVGTALTGFFPTEYGLYATTLLMSLGFHYYDTMHQSLALQWLPKAETAHGLGRVMSASAFAAIASFGLIYGVHTLLGLDYLAVYLLAGLSTLGIAIWLWLRFPYFEQPVVQRKELVLRRRYWLYYALTFMGGARRQIFIVFAGFMMVEKFDYSVTGITTLYLVNHAINMALAPQIGRMIARIGERRALTLEYLGLIVVFTSYAFVENAGVAGALYVIDHAFFAVAIAISTYFQKIADPADIAPTAGVAFTINHIAAVFLPVMLGFLWLWSPASVFLIGAAMAGVSLVLARLVPPSPAPGNEVIWSQRMSQTRPAE